MAVAAPFHDTGTDPSGRSAFGFRLEDRALREDVDRALREYIGTAEHLACVAPFGFGPGNLPEWSRTP